MSSPHMLSTPSIKAPVLSSWPTDCSHLDQTFYKCIICQDSGEEGYKERRLETKIITLLKLIFFLTVPINALTTLGMSVIPQPLTVENHECKTTNASSPHYFIHLTLSLVNAFLSLSPEVCSDGDRDEW